MTEELARMIQVEWDVIRRHRLAGRLCIHRNMETGTFFADMDHNFQKYHEEDAVAAVMDVMALAGWKFLYQYDSEVNSNKLSGASFSRREMFVFQK